MKRLQSILPFKRVASNLIFFGTFIAVIIILIFAFLVIRAQEGFYIEMVKRDAVQNTMLIKQSIRYHMMKNEKEDVRWIINEVGSQKGVKEIRIFDKEGRVTVASIKESVGLKVNSSAEGCVICHIGGGEPHRESIVEKTRIYYSPGGERLIGVIEPIYNEQPCFGCHPSNRKILGILDVTLSLSEVDKQISRNKKIILILTLSPILIISIALNIFVKKTISEPINQLLEGTHRISKGNLSHEIRLSSGNEIGELASSFNVMTRELRKSREELEAWSKELERRVKKATEELGIANRQLKETNEKLMRLDRAKSEFLRKVEHQLRAPLAAIKSCLQATMGDDVSELDEKYKDMIVRAEKRTGALILMVNDLLDLARIEEGISRTQIETVDLLESLRKAVELMQPKARDKKINLLVNLPEDLPDIMLNQADLEGIILNLLDNAIKYNIEGGNVMISSQVENEEIKIEIQDTGIGIPAEDVPRIFEEFYRGDTAKGREKEGTGLGLTIVKRAVEVYGGRIEVVSEPGRGSRFIVYFPKETKFHMEGINEGKA